MLEKYSKKWPYILCKNTPPCRTPGRHCKSPRRTDRSCWCLHLAASVFGGAPWQTLQPLDQNYFTFSVNYLSSHLSWAAVKWKTRFYLFHAFSVSLTFFTKLSCFHCQNGFSCRCSLGFSCDFVACILFISNACFAPQPKKNGKMMRYFLQKKQFECNCKHEQETNKRQHDATLGHNEQEPQIQKPHEIWTCFTAWTYKWKNKTKKHLTTICKWLTTWTCKCN
jgi:hypothetical protein